MRWVVKMKGPTEYVILPVPLPPLLEVIVIISGRLLVAVQLHPLGAITLTLPVPPVDPKDWPGGEIE